MPPRTIKKEARRDAEGIALVAAVADLCRDSPSPRASVPAGNSPPTSLGWSRYKCGKLDRRRNRQDSDGVVDRGAPARRREERLDPHRRLLRAQYRGGSRP